MIQSSDLEKEKLLYQIKSLEWKLLLLETSHADCKHQREDLMQTVSKLQQSFDKQIDHSGNTCYTNNCS